MYDKLIGSTANTAPVSIALIRLIPKSGTMSLLIFFHVYNLLLSKKSLVERDLFPYIVRQPEFAKEVFNINHCQCPGFLEHVDKASPEFAIWESLEYSQHISWERGFKKFNALDDMPGTKIVFVFRNPLDQLISLFKHYNHYPADEDLARTNSDPYKGLEEFIFDQHALDSYIKVFYSYHVMMQKFPQLFLSIPYEQLLHARTQTLRNIISFLDLPFDADAFNQAIALTSKEALSKHENTQNKSLMSETGDDLHRPRHIRNGNIGVWQNIMTPDMVQKIADRMQQLGLSLKMFYLADDFNPEFAKWDNSLRSKSKCRA